MRLLPILGNHLACILHGIRLRSLTDPYQPAGQPGDLVYPREMAGILALLLGLGGLNLAVDLLSPSLLSAAALALLSCALLAAVAWAGWLGFRAHTHWGEFRDYQLQVGLVFGIDLEQLQGVEDVWYLGAVFDQHAGVITCSAFTLTQSGARMQLGNRKFPWDAELPVAAIRAGIARLQQDPAELAAFLIRYGGLTPEGTAAGSCAERPHRNHPALPYSGRDNGIAQGQSHSAHEKEEQP
jgi:hypothetical protein